MPVHAFRKRDNILAKAVMRDQLLAHPLVRRALNDYLRSLNLEGQVKAGIMTPNQALVSFERALRDFSQRLHTTVNQRYATDQLDQTELSNPLNMATALNNPNSFASEQMNALALALLESAANEEAANNQALQEMQQTPAPENGEYLNDQNYAATTAALVAIEDVGLNAETTKQGVESAFHGITDLKSDYHTVMQEAEAKEGEKASSLVHDLKPRSDWHPEDEKK